MVDICKPEAIQHEPIELTGPSSMILSTRQDMVYTSSQSSVLSMSNSCRKSRKIRLMQMQETAVVKIIDGWYCVRTRSQINCVSRGCMK